MNREVIKFVIKDRMAIVMVALLVLTTIVVLVLLLFWLRHSDIQIPIRYSGYDGSLYNDQWFERISFIIFLLMQAIITVYASCVMHARGYRVFAYCFLGFGVFMAIATAVIALAVTRTVTL